MGADQRSQGLALQLARQPGRCKAFEKPALDPAGVGATRFVQEADARFRQLFPCPNTPLNSRTSWWLGRGASMGDITCPPTGAVGPLFFEHQRYQFLAM